MSIKEGLQNLKIPWSTDLLSANPEVTLMKWLVNIIRSEIFPGDHTHSSFLFKLFVKHKSSWLIWPLSGCLHSARQFMPVFLKHNVFIMWLSLVDIYSHIGVFKNFLVSLKIISVLHSGSCNTYSLPVNIKCVIFSPLSDLHKSV